MTDILTVNTTPIFPFKYIQEANYDFTFALLDSNNQVVHTPVMCKDYLSDIFWSENVGTKQESVWGLVWQRGMFDISSKTFKLLINGGAVNMEKKSELLQEFINQFDEAQGFSKTVVHKTDNDKMIVVEFSNEWATSSPLLSALTTMIRISGAYAGGPADEYIYSTLSQNDMPQYQIKEWQRLSSTKTKLYALLKGKKVEFSWDNLETMGRAHGCGIVGFSGFPKSSRTVKKVEVSDG